MLLLLVLRHCSMVVTWDPRRMSLTAHPIRLHAAEGGTKKTHLQPGQGGCSTHGPNSPSPSTTSGLLAAPSRENGMSRPVASGSTPCRLAKKANKARMVWEGEDRREAL